MSRSLLTGHFDPVVPGRKVNAIFGFCDIRNFTDCCEVLGEDTMIFTNSIANIVHNLVHDSGGVVNKNIGDAFLTVWKVCFVWPNALNVSVLFDCVILLCDTLITPAPRWMLKRLTPVNYY